MFVGHYIYIYIIWYMNEWIEIIPIGLYSKLKVYSTLDWEINYICPYWLIMDRNFTN